MMKHAKFFLRGFAVALVFAVCASGFWAITQLKAVDLEDNSTVSYVNFYKLPKDSADVLIIGSSHVRDAFIPQEIYDKYGVTSYNLACARQPILISYYWLKEALRYQHPKVVVLDANMMFYSKSADKPEPDIRKALDFMRWGKVKVEAINAVCKNYKGHSRISYYLPNIRYHDRWKSLEEVNFLLDEVVAAGNFMGFPGGRKGTNKLKFTPLTKGKAKLGKLEPIDGRAEDIVKLCRENGVKLVLVKTPMTWQTNERHAAIENFAKEHNIPFYDMNEEDIYSTLGLNFKADFVDYAHANMSGALKMTDYLGRLLSEKYGLQPHKSEPWEKTRQAYLNAKADYRLKTARKLDGYLKALKKGVGRYTALIAARGEDLLKLDKSSISALKSLGLKADFSGAKGKSYYAVLSGGKVLLEKMSGAGASYSGAL